MSESETASDLWPRRYGGVVVRRKSMSSTSRSAVITVSLPAVLRTTAASSPMPATSECPETAVRCRRASMKSNSLLVDRLWSGRCSCSSRILKDYDEVNRALLLLFRLKWKRTNASDFHLAHQKLFPAQSRP